MISPTEIFLLCLMAGFVAQMIDGSLGMGYGVILSILLFSMGLPPIQVSASVHLAKFFSTGVSGYSHLKFGNVERRLVVPLAIGGVIGAVLGAYTLKNLPTDIISPVIALYLTIMGIVIVYKALNRPPLNGQPRQVGPLGAMGGFFDAIGGGGWGIIVTSGLLVKGKNPRLAIGSVSLAEFFVSVTIVGLLISEIPQLLTQVSIIGGMVIGSALAAPLAAYVCGKVPARPLMLIVGSFIIVLSGISVVTVMMASVR